MNAAAGVQASEEGVLTPHATAGLELGSGR